MISVLGRRNRISEGAQALKSHFQVSVVLDKGTFATVGQENARELFKGALQAISETGFFPGEWSPSLGRLGGGPSSPSASDAKAK